MIAPLVAPGGGMSSMLLIGGITFVILCGAIIGWFWLNHRDQSNPWDDFAEATASIVEDENADAIALLAYSDGPLLPKPAIYDRELLGGKGGYRTPDGERIYMDGQGNGRFSLQGTDVILAIDPTEHAAGADPLKAYIAHENDLGRWIQHDRKGNIIAVGEALASIDDITPAMEEPMPDQATIADGGYPSQVHEKAAEDGMSLEDAKAALESAGVLDKIVDIAPPREAHIDENGELKIEEATHVCVGLSSAANLLPKKTNTTDWQTVEEKARQEGRDEEKIREYMTVAFVVGGVVGGGIGVVMSLIFAFT